MGLKRETRLIEGCWYSVNGRAAWLIWGRCEVDPCLWVGEGESSARCDATGQEGAAAVRVS